MGAGPRLFGPGWAVRIGIGYDVHAFDASLPLVLGGVSIAGAPGLAGWSDADVIAHAIIDAILGAAGLGDLGKHFPEDAVAEGASSLELLAQAARLTGENGFRVVNVDCTVVIQDVPIAPHRHAMQKRIASALSVDERFVSVKATSTDRIGFTGRGEGASAIAVALLEES
jgi:2-C-methyl-D-erythritol 2,4-cyclodiphosphate synthase